MSYERLKSTSFASTQGLHISGYVRRKQNTDTAIHIFLHMN